ncbi:MAG: hypothetical protein J5W83_09900 [Candidatus Accumulibacter sp.]|uniref:hypothetical protein n=1 Tax=Accumulibacter sp. TaxID=2053492 RepID=UPI001B2F07BF|nr:hypothetical protein [Accumulibacter sp.]MBO3702840.1 hypothetical protein [Accumulibacter sp.]
MPSSKLESRLPIPAPSIRPGAKLTTAAISEKFGVKPHTPVASYCRHGHWMGLIPTKLPNNWLLWDESEADALLVGRAVKADPEKIDEHFKRKTSDASKRPAHIVRKAEAAKAKRLSGVTTGELVQ